MALSEKHRSSIYQSFVPILGEEEAEALVSEFPAAGLDVPATKEFVRAEVAEVQTAISVTKGELKAEIAELRGELRTEMAQGFKEVIQRQNILAGALATTVVTSVALATYITNLG